MHAVFTDGYINSIKIDTNLIGLIWGVSLAASTCRVKGVKMGRYALTQ